MDRGAAEIRSLLERVAACLEQLGASSAPASGRLRALRERLEEERLHLAVLGQFKRGKSTLLNALLGEAVLPAAVVPLTAIPTFLRAGPARLARVFFTDGRAPESLAADRPQDVAAFLARFVTEEANPENRLGVSHGEVFHPAPILAGGVVLIDTPGIGSTYRHNTETTLRFLPQCDAALFVVSADPPLTEAELDFLREVRARVARVILVLNKVDYLDREGRAEAVAFLRAVVRERLGMEDAPVFCVSARQGLSARQAGDSGLWERSGMAEVERHLLGFLAAEKAAVLAEAVAHKGADQVAEALLQVRLTIRSLQMPLAELEERLRSFEQTLREAERQQTEAADLLQGERGRLVAFLEEQAEGLRRRARTFLAGIVREHLDRAGPGLPKDNALQEDVAAAIPGFFAREGEKLGQDLDRRLREAFEGHRRRTEELVQTVRQTAARLFDVPYHPWGGPDALEAEQHPYWVSRTAVASLNEIHLDLLERILPPGVRRARLERRLLEQVDTLVLHNVENLRWATLQNLDRTLRRFREHLQGTLREAARTVDEAIRAALARRREQAEAVKGDLARLERAAAELADIEASLRDLCTGSGAALAQPR